MLGRRNDTKHLGSVHDGRDQLQASVTASTPSPALTDHPHDARTSGAGDETGRGPDAAVPGADPTDPGADIAESA